VYWQNETCRVIVCEHQQWCAAPLLFGLLKCPVAPRMKAELLGTLAALARTPELADSLWHALEASQVRQKSLYKILENIYN
jgi:hypothetical protein